MRIFDRATRRCAKLVPGVVVVGLSMLFGCSPRDPFANPFAGPEKGWARVPDQPFVPHGLPMFDGRRGTILTWYDLSEAVAWADVIIIGEQHDDPVAHAVQQAIVMETIARFPRVVLSMEMLERDDQPLIDAYLRGEIEVDAFIDGTDSRHWAGRDTWVIFFQPMIDAAKASGAPVVGANAPRRLVRQARLEGYDALRALPADEQALFALPRRESKPEYRARFDTVMSGMSDAKSFDSTAFDSVFRSQLVWDATMAESIVDARRSAASLPGRPFSPPKVIHLVGQFHSDFDGGLVDEIAVRNGFLRICTISVQRRSDRTLGESDRDRAAIVIYSGERPPPEAASPASETPEAPVAPETPDMPVMPIAPEAPLPPVTLESNSEASAEERVQSPMSFSRSARLAAIL
ncbi:MAG: ChaN family lipoprotein [Phycisphaeraceae bacterium]|nr:ChaN family lipoprotein [Phycisphaeraceae bacterium]